MEPGTVNTTARSVLYQRLILGALIAVCLAPFFANTSPDEKARMTIKAVALGAAVCCVYLNRARFVLRPTLAGSVVGTLLIIAGALLTLADFKGMVSEPGLGLILGPMGIAIAVTGFHFSALHWRCIGLFALAAVPAGRAEDLIEHSLGYSTIVANVAAFSMHYVGLDVATQGDTIHVNGHTVRVIAECSGLKLFFLLFAFFFIILLLLPDTRRIIWRMLFAALGTGLVISIARVDLLVLIVDNAKWFEFFHHGLGSELISMVAILTFAFFIKEPLITALEKMLPVPPLPAANLPSPHYDAQLKLVLALAIVIGLTSGALVKLAT